MSDGKASVTPAGRGEIAPFDGARACAVSHPDSDGSTHRPRASASHAGWAAGSTFAAVARISATYTANEMPKPTNHA